METKWISFSEVGEYSGNFILFKLDAMQDTDK